MSFDDKPSETSPEAVDQAFFEGPSEAGLSKQDPVAHVPEEPPVAARPSGAPVSAADGELRRVPDDVSPDFDEDAVLGRNRGLHVGAFFVVFAAAVAGSVAGYRAFRPDEPQPSAKASVSASAKVVAAPTNSTAPVAQASAEASAKTNAVATKASASATGGSGFAGTNAGAGANVGGPRGEPVGTGELSAGEISGVVERNRPLIRRRCWQPAVEARAGMGGSARVQASFTIAPSGSVSAVSAGGAEDDFPGLSSCIAARIREWKFPASASSTPVNVPFVFAAQ